MVWHLLRRQQRVEEDVGAFDGLVAEARKEALLGVLARIRSLPRLPAERCRVGVVVAVALVGEAHGPSEAVYGRDARRERRAERLRRLEGRPDRQVSAVELMTREGGVMVLIAVITVWIMAVWVLIIVLI